MPKQGDVHVVHRANQGKWVVEVEGAGRAESSLYGNDPRRSKG